MKNVYLENIQNCNAGGKVLMLTNGGHLSFSQMRSLLLLPMIVHMNESSMVNILFFSELANIAGMHIKMDTSKEKVVNVHNKGSFFISKGLFYTNLDEPSMITNTSIVSVNSFYYLSTVKRNSNFY